MLTGRKLLLADDSIAIQRVVELTFADEGMEVTSVGDGLRALEQIEQFTPDVILADAFMPGVNGYELCRSIKENQRWAKIPVILLVSTFEPFNEADARQAGADDVVTKPFQSIRQLVNRVGALLGGGAGETAPSEYAATEGTDLSGPAAGPANGNESNVTVLVEAAQLDTSHASQASSSAGAPDIDFQIADTQRLEKADVKPDSQADADDLLTQDTMEIESVVEPAPEMVAVSSGSTDYIGHHESMNQPTIQTEQFVAPKFNESVLDLGDEEFRAGQAVTDDLVLDLDFGDQRPIQPAEDYPEVTLLDDDAAPFVYAEEIRAEQISPERQDLSIAVQPQSQSVTDESKPAAGAPVGELSADAIEAIARRVVEQMSDKVIREIAWDVVPELSELLIKRKLEEQK